MLVINHTSSSLAFAANPIFHHMSKKEARQIGAKKIRVAEGVRKHETAIRTFLCQEEERSESGEVLKQREPGREILDKAFGEHETVHIELKNTDSQYDPVRLIITGEHTNIPHVFDINLKNSTDEALTELQRDMKRELPPRRNLN